MIIKLSTVLSLVISLSLHLFAAGNFKSLRTLDLTESADTLSNKLGVNNHRVSLSAGIARSFGFAGITASYDCGDYWGG